MTERTQWEYLVLQISAQVVADQWSWLAIAWSDTTEVYRAKLDGMYITKPMADLGREGWEVVGNWEENVLVPNGQEGLPPTSSFPARNLLYFKRPKID